MHLRAIIRKEKEVAWIGLCSPLNFEWAMGAFSSAVIGWQDTPDSCMTSIYVALLVVKKDTYRTVAWVNTNQGVRTEAETGDITNHRETVKI